MLDDLSSNATNNDTSSYLFLVNKSLFLLLVLAIVVIAVRGRIITAIRIRRLLRLLDRGGWLLLGLFITVSLLLALVSLLVTVSLLLGLGLLGTGIRARTSRITLAVRARIRSIV